MKIIDGHDVIEHAEVNGESREFIKKLTDYIEDTDEVDAIPRAYHDKVCECLYERHREQLKAVEPKQGEWIYVDEPMIGNPYGRYKCSECNREEPFTSDFCPNCGCRMKGVDDE